MHVLCPYLSCLQLDWTWPFLLQYPSTRIGVVDAACMLVSAWCRRAAKPHLGAAKPHPLTHVALSLRSTPTQRKARRARGAFMQPRALTALARRRRGA